MQSKSWRIKRCTSIAALLALIATFAVVTGARGGCVTESAGCETCTVCNRYILIGDDICNDSYWYCTNPCTNSVEGGGSFQCW